MSRGQETERSVLDRQSDPFKEVKDEARRAKRFALAIVLIPALLIGAFVLRSWLEPQSVRENAISAAVAERDNILDGLPEPLTTNSATVDPPLGCFNNCEDRNVDNLTPADDRIGRATFSYSIFVEDELWERRAQIVDRLTEAGFVFECDSSADDSVASAFFSRDDQTFVAELRHRGEEPIEGALTLAISATADDQRQLPTPDHDASGSIRCG